MTPSPMAVSVVIPLFNGAATIGQQLDALARQECEVSFEVIVADNRSTDLGAQVVRDAMENFPVPLRLVDASARQGASHARNTGVLASQGDVLAFCDADDIVFSTWVQMAYEGGQHWPVTVGHNHLMEDPLNEDSPVLNPGFVMGLGFASCNFAIRRESYFAVGGFNESLPRYGYEDTDLTLRLGQAGIEIGPNPGMQIHFRPTAAHGRRLRKIYLSGYSSMIAKAQLPQIFGEIRSRDAIVHLLRLPLDYQRRGGRPGRHPIGELATRLGVVHACLTRVTPGRIPEPIFITVDPLSTREGAHAGG